MRYAALFAASLFLLSACGQPAPEASGASGAAPSSSTASPTAPAALAPEEIATRVAALPAPYNSGDYEAGRRVAAQCRSCHTFTAGGRQLTGPNLAGLFSRQVGTVEGFSYSNALREADFVWDYARLDQWLQDPRGFLPGNRMAFSGIRREEERRNLITFLHVETTR